MRTPERGRPIPPRMVCDYELCTSAAAVALMIDEISRCHYEFICVTPTGDGDEFYVFFRRPAPVVKEGYYV